MTWQHESDEEGEVTTLAGVRARREDWLDVCRLISTQLPRAHWQVMSYLVSKLGQIGPYGTNLGLFKIRTNQYSSVRLAEPKCTETEL